MLKKDEPPLANAKQLNLPEMQPQAGIPLSAMQLQALKLPRVLMADPLGMNYGEMANNPEVKALMDRADKLRMNERDLDSEGEYYLQSVRESTVVRIKYSC